MSVLAIESRLMDKIPTLYRSSGFPEMSDEDLSHLAGETPESSQERKRLEAKRGILMTGLQSLKSLQKRGNVVKPTKQDRQGLPKDSEGTSARTPSRSGSSGVDSRDTQM